MVGRRLTLLFVLFQLVSLDGLHSGVPTRTTPTLTPTTLRSIEQTFLELTSESGSHSREAGFVPPLVEPSQPTPAQTQNTQNNNNNNNVLLENQQSQSHQLHDLQQQQQNHHQTRRNMGGRRPTRTIGMSPEEEERRQVRRERNKMAAARCRKRRMDHTNSLLEVSVRDDDIYLSHEHGASTLLSTSVVHKCSERALRTNVVHSCCNR